MFQLWWRHNDLATALWRFALRAVLAVALGLLIGFLLRLTYVGWVFWTGNGEPSMPFAS